jgi:hypothetical protein
MRLEPDELSRIEDMAAPEILESRRRNQILALTFFLKQRCIGLNPFECFT